MDIGQIRSALTSEIHAPPLSELVGLRLASVLIIIYGKNPFIIMTKRSRKIKRHAGEIAFPGGNWVEKDGDFITTAIRETKEELDLEVSKEQIIGQLDNVVTLNSRYNIIPFIAILDAVPALVANSEVESILHIPLESFLNTMGEDIEEYHLCQSLSCNLPEHRSIEEMYTFTFEKHNVWGASARMLKQINTLLSKKNLL